MIVHKIDKDRDVTNTLPNDPRPTFIDCTPMIFICAAPYILTDKADFALDNFFTASVYLGAIHMRALERKRPSGRPIDSELSDSA